MITPKKQLTTMILLFLNLPILYCQSSFANFGNLEMHTNSNLSIFGDVENYGNFSSNIGDVYISGTTEQNISGSSLMKVGNLILNNNLKLDLELQVKNTLSFNNTIITTDRADNATEFIHFFSRSNLYWRIF